MAESEGFRDRIRTFGEAVRGTRLEKRQLQKRAMTELDESRQRFEEVACTLFAEVVEPRLRCVADELDGVAYEPVGDIHHGTLDFNQDGRYVATVRLHVGIAPGGPDAIELVSRPHVIPLLVDVRAEHLSLPLDRVDRAAAECFVEESIGRFLDTYVHMQDIPGYQALNTVTDPVCGMELDRVDALGQARHLGRTYYFCVQDCYDRFAQDPDRYARRG